MKNDVGIEIRNLTVRFGPRCLFDSLSIRLAPGEKATVTGRSGSGKTTLLRCVLGFVVPDPRPYGPRPAPQHSAGLVVQAL